jgi:glycolate oxidase FAD binding subunit
VELIHPHTKADVADAMRTASGMGTRVLIVGGRRHMDRGNPVPIDAELWTTQLDRVVAYDPQELIAVVEAGMRYGDLATMLSEHQQEWPVDAPEDATVGGVIAAGVSSPRRLRVGHIRDTVVELELVTGDGRLIRSGARTVKNVTGYDIHRLATGSLGTLGVIVQAAVKVRPLPEAVAGFRARGDGLTLGGRLLKATPAAAGVAATLDALELRLEGWRDEVKELTELARATVTELEPIDTSTPFPAAQPWLDERAAIVIEVAVPPSRIATLVEELSGWTALLGVGLVWFTLDEDDPAERLTEIRRRAADLGGIAPAIRGPGGLGDTTVPGLEIHRRLKEAFDPAGILAPGRFWGEL